MTYIRLVAFEAILVCVCATCLTYEMLDAFYIAESLWHGPLPGVVATLFTLVLFAVAKDKRTALPGGIAVAVLCIIAIIVSFATAPDGAFLADTEENYFYFTIVAIVVPLVSFGLSRSHAGCVALFGLGAFICGWMQFFYEFHNLAVTIVFCVAALMLVIFKNYQHSARRATSVRSLSFSAGFVVACLAALASVGIACLVWVCIIAPLNPDAVEIKLIQEYRALEEVLVVGTSDVEMVPNMDLTSDDTIDMERTTDDLVESDDGRQEPANPSSQSSSQEEQSGSFMGFDAESLNEVFENINYDDDDVKILLYILIVLAILILLAIIAYFIGRRVLRNKRLETLRMLPPDKQVEGIWLYLRPRFERIGFAMPKGPTLAEFAANNDESLREFREESGVAYSTVALAYETSVYGDVPLLQSQADDAAAFYKSFWKAARKKLGNVKYFFKSFRL